MSWKAVAYAVGLHLDPAGNPLSFSEKALLLYLADAFNDELGCAWPAVKNLAAASHLGERQIRTILQSLHQRGVIRTEARKRPDGSHTSNYHYLPALPPQGGNPSPGPANIAGPSPKKLQEAPANDAGGHANIAGGPGRIAGRDPISDPISDPVTEPITETTVRETRGKRAQRQPLTEEERGKLIAEYGPSLRVPLVEEMIEEALANQAVKKWESEYLYVRGWLRRERDRRPNPSPVKGGHQNGYQPYQPAPPPSPTANRAPEQPSFRAPAGWREAETNGGGATV